MSDLPNTEKHSVVIAAVAWEITKLSVKGKTEFLERSPAERHKKLTNYYIDAYQAALNQNKID